MKNRTLSIQFLCPDLDDGGGDPQVVVVYDPRAVTDLSNRLSAADCERLVVLLEPCLRIEGKNDPH
jgi:hypothetical protein